MVSAPQLQTAGGGWNELSITVGRCRDLKKSRGSQQPSPYVVYKFFDFPDYPTTTVHDCCDPVLNDLKSYCVSMDTDLDQYLKSEMLLFYVFDYKEEQMDTYMGKARVPLLSLAKDQPVTGEHRLGLCPSAGTSVSQLLLGQMHKGCVRTKTCVRLFPHINWSL